MKLVKVIQKSVLKICIKFKKNNYLMYIVVKYGVLWENWGRA